jgi:LruC domain-containing protein
VSANSNQQYKGSKFSNIFSFLGTYDNQGVPNYLEPQRAVVSDSLLKSINASLPESKPVPSFHPDYIAGDAGSLIKIVETGDVWINFVSEGAGYKNVIAFYVYDSTSPPTSINNDTKNNDSAIPSISLGSQSMYLSNNKVNELKFIFPNLSYKYSGGGLQAGDKVYLGNFPAGVTIGFVLIANGYNYSGKYINDGYHQVFSNSILNKESTEEKRQHFVTLWNEEEEKVIMGIEDLNRDQNSDDDFNDAIYFITSNPKNAIDVSAFQSTDIDKDSDGDGVTDLFDDYPYEAEKAFDNYSPFENEYGTYLFEDKWPSKGDYDFNDIVIKYNYKYTTDVNNKVSEIVLKMKVDATGASYQNSFCLQLPFEPSDIESVEGTKIYDNYLEIEQNGVEKGTTRAVIPIIDNLNKIQGSFGNVYKDKPYIENAPFEIRIKLKKAISINGIDNLFNPFIIINKNRENEVHLKGYQPTSKANFDKFETKDDKSQSTGIYYTDINGMPWALDLPNEFKHLLERENLEDNYLRFKDWAMSSGSSDTDWYLPESTNYVASKVYDKDDIKQSQGIKDIYTFNFSSKTKINTNIPLTVDGKNYPQTRVYIYSKDRERYYKSSFSNADGNVDLILGIPSYETEIRLVFMTADGEKVLDYKVK